MYSSLINYKKKADYKVFMADSLDEIATEDIPQNILERWIETIEMRDSFLHMLRETIGLEPGENAYERLVKGIDDDPTNPEIVSLLAMYSGLDGRTVRAIERRNRYWFGNRDDSAYLRAHSFLGRAIEKGRDLVTSTITNFNAKSGAKVGALVGEATGLYVIGRLALYSIVNPEASKYIEQNPVLGASLLISIMGVHTLTWAGYGAGMGYLFSRYCRPVD